MSEDPRIPIMIVRGVEGPSLYINNHRVAGPKPWGGGTIQHEFKMRVTDLKRALGKELCAALGEADQ